MENGLSWITAEWRVTTQWQHHNRVLRRRDRRDLVSATIRINHIVKLHSAGGLLRSIISWTSSLVMQSLVRVNHRHSQLLSLLFFFFFVWLRQVTLGQTLKTNSKTALLCRCPCATNQSVQWNFTCKQTITCGDERLNPNTSKFLTQIITFF